MPLPAVLQHRRSMQQIWTMLQRDGPNHLGLMPLRAVLQRDWDSDLHLQPA